MKKRSILTFMLALIAALSMTMMGKVNVQAKSPTYWYYSDISHNKITKKCYEKWNKNKITVHAAFYKMKTTSYKKALDYVDFHQITKFKIYTETFKVSPKVKLQVYDETGFSKLSKKEMKSCMKDDMTNVSFKVNKGVVYAICLYGLEYLGE